MIFLSVVRIHLLVMSWWWNGFILRIAHWWIRILMTTSLWLCANTWLMATDSKGRHSIVKPRIMLRSSKIWRHIYTCSSHWGMWTMHIGYVTSTLNRWSRIHTTLSHSLVIAVHLRLLILVPLWYWPHWWFHRWRLLHKARLIKHPWQRTLANIARWLGSHVCRLSPLLKLLGMRLCSHFVGVFLLLLLILLIILHFQFLLNCYFIIIS